MQINPINSSGNVAGLGFNRPAGFDLHNFTTNAAAAAMNYVLDVRERAASMAAGVVMPESRTRPPSIDLTNMLEGLQRIRELAILSTAPQITDEELEEVQEEVNQTLDYIQDAAQRTRYNNGGMATAYFATENTSLQTLGIAGLDVANYWPDIAAIDNAINMVTNDIVQEQGGGVAFSQLSNEEAARIVEEYMHEVAAGIMSEINALTQEIGQQERQLYGNGNGNGNGPDTLMSQVVRTNNGYNGNGNGYNGIA